MADRRSLFCLAAALACSSLAAGQSDGLGASYTTTSSGSSGGILTGLHPHVYVKGGGSIVFPLNTDSDSRVSTSDDLELKSKVGFGYHGAVGLRLGPGPKPWSEGLGFRLEAEYAQRFFDTDGLFVDDVLVRDLDGDLDVTTIMGNVLLDVTAANLRGYVGVGIGYAEVDASVNGISDSDSGIALQCPIGFETQLVPHVWLDVGMRFLYIPDLNSQSDLDEYSILTTEVYAGLAFEI